MYVRAAHRTALKEARKPGLRNKSNFVYSQAKNIMIQKPAAAAAVASCAHVAPTRRKPRAQRDRRTRQNEAQAAEQAAYAAARELTKKARKCCGLWSR